jgi:hypothetical protein
MSSFRIEWAVLGAILTERATSLSVSADGERRSR